VSGRCKFTSCRSLRLDEVITVPDHILQHEFICRPHSYFFISYDTRFQALLSPYFRVLFSLCSLCTSAVSHTERSMFIIAEVLVCTGLRWIYCLDNYTCFVARLQKATPRFSTTYRCFADGRMLLL
jgi:hypothetical protein